MEEPSAERAPSRHSGHRRRLLLLVVGAVGLVPVAALVVLLDRGISARDEPTAMESVLARGMRRLAIPAGTRALENPLPASTEVLARARAHFADHCAGCHGNDGRGRTQLGRNLYPKAPDMAAAETQALSDGELFAIIENGVRLTGMPAWGGPGPEDDDESWELVHFIRRLPNLTPDELAEMQALNPRSPEEWREEEEVRRFLQGEETSGGRSTPAH